MRRAISRSGAVLVGGRDRSISGQSKPRGQSPAWLRCALQCHGPLVRTGCPVAVQSCQASDARVQRTRQRGALPRETVLRGAALSEEFKVGPGAVGTGGESQESETAAKDTQSQAGRVSQLSIDMSDILFYLYHHSAVSGIQRVVAEVLPHIDAATGCQLVAFSESRAEFVVLEKKAVLSLLDHVRHCRDADVARTRIMVTEIWDTIDRLPGLCGRPGDVLALLGAAWSYEDVFRVVAALKRQGVAVVVLIYDLIPVVFPGFPEAVVTQFRQYLPKVAALADRVPAISSHSRADFERYCQTRGLAYPGGAATKLAADQWSEDKFTADTSKSWDRPYVLMVSTVEARKNHILAFRCWQRLLAEHGAEFVPDLLCVGRIGWNAFEFLSEFEETAGLRGRIHLLSDAISDTALSSLYRGCLFTVYPSRYEGWGLPITESLMAGKPVIAARNTSLTEAGGEFARYFEDDDLDGFYAAVESYLLDPAILEDDALKIKASYRALSWRDVAQCLIGEFELARANRRPFVQRIEPGYEYGLMTMRNFEGGSDGTKYLDFLHAERRMRLTGQIIGAARSVSGDLSVSGSGLVRTHNGRSVKPGGHMTISFERPECPNPVLVIALSEDSEPVSLRVRGPMGVADFVLGSAEAFRVPLGTGVVGEVINVELRSCPGSLPRSFSVASFVVTASAAESELLVNRDFLQRIAAERNRLEAARFDAETKLERYRLEASSQLEAITTSTSWRITRPMRSTVEALRRARRK